MAEKLGGYQVSGLKVDQQVFVEPVEFPEDGVIYTVERITEEVTLSGPGDVKLSVDLETLCRERTDTNGVHKFTPLAIPEIRFDK